MASIGTLGSLISQLGATEMPQYNPQEVARQQQLLQAGRTSNETALLTLADLKRQQEAQAALYQRIQQDPGILLGGGGGDLPPSTLSTLSPGGPGAITQSPLPGMPGQAQTIAAPQDLSRYAGVSPQGGGPLPAGVGMPTVTPPQSTLGGLTAPPSQDPARALLQQNPQAGLQLLDLRSKLQTQQLTMREKVAEAIASELLGATNQESYDVARQNVARISPQWAAALPQTYSKEAVQPFIDRALSAKEMLTARTEQAKIQVLLRGQDVDMLKLQQQGGKLHYEKDAQGNIVAVPEYAGGTGGVQSRPVLGPDGQPIKSLEGQKLTADQQKTIRTQEGELRNHVDVLLKDYYAVRDAIGRIEASGAEPSAAGDLALITAFMKMLDPTTGVRDVEFKNAATAGGFLEQIKARFGYVESGERLSDDMRKDLLTRSRKLYEQYEKDYGQVKQQYRDLTTRLGGDPANVVLETSSTAAKPSTTGKPVTEMSREELLAERDALRNKR